MAEDDELKRIENEIDRAENRVNSEIENENERLRREIGELKKEQERLKKLKDEGKRLDEINPAKREKITEVEIQVNFDGITKFFRLLYFILIQKKALFYVLLIIAVIIGVVIRSASLPALGASPLIGNNFLGMGGSLTGLDPYIFYIQTNNIVNTGNVPTINHIEYLPLGKPSRTDALLISFFDAYVFRLMQPIFPAATTMTWAMIYPVIAALLSTLLLFLICLDLFENQGETVKYSIATLSAFMFPVFQTLLNRTTAGFSTKDAMGFLFILLAIYFLIKALKSKDRRTKIMYGFMVALATGLDANTSGFFKFLTFLIPLVYITLILLDHADKDDLYSFLPFGLFIPFWASFFTVTSSTLTESIQYYPIYICYVMVLFKLFVYDKYKRKLKIPFVNAGVSVAIYSGIVTAVALGVLGRLPRVVEYIITNIQYPLGIGVINPVTQTIAEYGQVTLAGRICDASGLTGVCGDPNTISINFIILSLAGILLLYYFLKRFKHWYVPFLLALPFMLLLFGAIYTPGNGATSMLVMFILGAFIPAIYMLWHRREPGVKKAVPVMIFLTLVSIMLAVSLFLSNQTSNYYKYGLFGIVIVFILAMAFDKIDYAEKTSKIYMVAFIFFLLAMLFSNLENQLLEGVGFVGVIVVPFAAVLVPAVLVRRTMKTFRSHKSLMWTISSIIIIVAFLVIAVDLNSSLNTSYIASQQSGSGLALWGPTMQWINYNTPVNSTLLSWWDYGYWEEAIANRTTVADGSNSYGFQSMIAKYFFEATSPYQYATFLNFMHRPTYAVISGSEVEKFSAISTIALNYTQFTPFGESQVAHNQGTISAGDYQYIAVFGGNNTGVAPLEANMVINGVPWSASNTLLVEAIIPFNYTNSTYTQGPPYGVVYNELTQQVSSILPLRYMCAYSIGCGIANASQSAIPGAVMMLNANNTANLHLGGYQNLPGGYAVAQIPLSYYGNSPGLLFMPEKSLNTLFTKLYLLNETVPGFSLAFTDNLPVNSILSISNQVLTNINVYKINYTALSAYMLQQQQCSVDESATNYCANLSYLPAVFSQNSTLIANTQIP